MSLNPGPNNSRKGRSSQSPPLKDAKFMRSLSSKRPIFKSEAEDSRLSTLRKEICFQGHLFVPQNITGNLLHTERQRIKVATSTSYIAKNQEILTKIRKTVGDESNKSITKGFSPIKMDCSMNKLNKNSNETITRIYRTPKKRGNSPNITTERKEFNIPIIRGIEEKFIRHRSFDAESIEYKKIALPKNLKGTGNMPSRDTVEPRKEQEKWPGALATQQSFTRASTEENLAKHRRMSTETEQDEMSYNFKRERSGIKAEDVFRGTFAISKDTDSSINEKSHIVEDATTGKLRMTSSVDRFKRAQEFRKESSNLEKQLYNEIESMTKVLRQKLNG